MQNYIRNNSCNCYKEKVNRPAKPPLKKVKKIRNVAKKIKVTEKKFKRTPFLKRTRKFPKPRFDEATGDIIIGTIKCHIANLGKIQYSVCEHLFKLKLGRKVTADEIERDYFHGDEPKSGTWLKDAVININKKVNKTFKIPRLIIYKNVNLYIGKEIFK